jgi:hypothetical protein
MTEHALVSSVDVIDRFASNIDPTVQTKPGWRWLPVEETNPPFDPATQVQTGPVVTVEAARVTRVWTMRDKTAPELAAGIDAEKESTLDRFDVLAFKVLFDHENRLRALEGKAAITAAQFRAALKARL